jgi:hypothetical protein
VVKVSQTSEYVRRLLWAAARRPTGDAIYNLQKYYLANNKAALQKSPGFCGTVRRVSSLAKYL